MHYEDELQGFDEDEEVAIALQESVKADQARDRTATITPDSVYVIPLNRRPFF